MGRSRSFAALLLLLLALPAHAVYRCEIDGRTVYRDLPCAGGQQVDIQLPPQAEDAHERAARERKELAQIEKEAARKAQAERKERRRREREQASLQRRCEKLALRAKWTAEDAAARASGSGAEKAARKAERVAEQYRAECASLEKKDGLVGISSR